MDQSKMKWSILLHCLACSFFLTAFLPAIGQPELAPWGNLTGIRIDGELMAFETSLSVVKNDGGYVNATGKERQRPMYFRKGEDQMVKTNLDSLYFTETVTDQGNGKAKINVALSARADDSPDGIYVELKLPVASFANATIQLNHAKPQSITDAEKKYVKTQLTSLNIIAAERQLSISFDKPVIVQSAHEASDKKFIRFLIPILKGTIKNGQTAAISFTIKASGVVDKKPITMALNTTQTGRAFDGFGGNFRLQNPKADPQVIDYCLQNMRVAWGRVEMPWRFWQPAIDADPIAAANAGKLHPQVKAAMEMAQRLYKIGMPVILTAWSAPAWAIVGTPRFRPGPDHVWGNPIDHSKTTEIYQSIADYIQYLKDAYGVEITDFSFNESDLGINIRQTGAEHAELIKGLGAYFVSRGLKTKLLLGDNSDATTYTFIDDAMNDAATHPYIGAVSFHSWRGWDEPTLQKWADAATTLNLPLIVGEGSIDAQAWGYPAIFKEPTYALEEINLYTRLLSICQPASILQWQLTSDYSPLIGGGMFGDDGPLRPTQRFWNLKQLAVTPAGLKAMPLSTTATNISAAAMGDNEKDIYAIHLVNNGAERPLTLTGIPENVTSLQVYVTDKNKGMEAGHAVAVVNGTASLILDATSYTTLVSK